MKKSGVFQQPASNELIKKKYPKTLLPNAPMHDDEVLSSDPAYRKGIIDTRNGALTQAKSICDNPKKCCKQVTIYYFDAPKNDNVEDALIQNKKPMKEIYDCKSHRIIKTINNFFATKPREELQNQVLNEY